MGFSALADCLLVVPAEYRDFNQPVYSLPAPDTGKRHYIVLTLRSSTLFSSSGVVTTRWDKATRLQMKALDSKGASVSVTVFGNVWPYRGLKPGDELHVYGEVSLYEGSLQITSPEPVTEQQRKSVIPVYRGGRGKARGEAIEAGVKAALATAGELDLACCLLLERAGLRESEFFAETGVRDPADLLLALHMPSSILEGEAAREIAKKLSLKAILNNAARNAAIHPVRGSSLPIGWALITELVARLPWALTACQRRAIYEIVSDLRSPYPMSRLLSGDVGTGKTAAFLVPAVAAHLIGKPVAIISPNGLIVAQIAAELREYFPHVPVHEVVAGAPPPSQKGIMVGTTALLHAARKRGLEFSLIIVDEQHRFSADQRTKLMLDHTNILEATATAIPRTVALVQFGGMSLSTLKTSPVKKSITTRIYEREEKAKLFGLVENVIRRGRQVAVVYPRAEHKTGGRTSAEAAAARFERNFPGRVALLHGKMEDEEKHNIIAILKSKKVDVLITTTVIEIGLTLPDLAVVVVVRPEYFGASQLHQLRGRVARLGGQGFMALYLEEEVDRAARDRLELLVQCSDGFELADRDADLRGFGEVDAESDAQRGAARMLFWGVTLTRQEIDAGYRAHAARKTYWHSKVKPAAIGSAAPKVAALKQEQVAHRKAQPKALKPPAVKEAPTQSAQAAAPARRRGRPPKHLATQPRAA